MTKHYEAGGDKVSRSRNLRYKLWAGNQNDPEGKMFVGGKAVSRRKARAHRRFMRSGCQCSLPVSVISCRSSTHKIRASNIVKPKGYTS